jgi:small subunit ribosomal protein S8
MVNDPIADFIIRIKNANTAGKDTVSVSYSKMKEAIATVLHKEGYLKSVEKKGKTAVTSLEVGLVYEGDTTPKIQGVERMSKLSKRMYLGSSDIKPVRNGYGRLILTTPQGILTDGQARKQKVGGEALFKIW